MKGGKKVGNEKAGRSAVLEGYHNKGRDWHDWKVGRWEGAIGVFSLIPIY